MTNGVLFVTAWVGEKLQKAVGIGRGAEGKDKALGVGTMVNTLRPYPFAQYPIPLPFAYFCVLL